MRPQWIAWIAIGIVALYVVFTVIDRMQEGRCRTGRGGLECTYRKPVVVIPDRPGVVA